MQKAIIALVGPSGCGKTTLLLEMLRRFPERLRILKSLTTRWKRSDEDDMFYNFTTVGEFERMVTDKKIVQYVLYAGNYYGNDVPHTEEVLGSAFGINAMVDQGIRNFRELGYTVTTIRITPIGSPGRDDELRKKEDTERLADPYYCDVEIENDFGPGGLARAADQLAGYIAGFIDGYDEHRH